MTRFLCSMINLMEGIIPEYDRKGKVRSPYSPPHCTLYDTLRSFMHGNDT